MNPEGCFLTARHIRVSIADPDDEYALRAEA